MLKRKYSLIFALLLGVSGALLYLPGTGGAFYYDDYSNLGGLAYINDWSSFWDFIYSGSAGPLGRPLSLLTFAIQHSDWPANGEYLFLVNIFIHGCNVALVFLTACQLYRLTTNESPSREKEFALVAAAFWMCSPILASSSLILIQRMTTLCAFFILLSVLMYLKAFEFFEEKPGKRLVLQALILGVGTLLATYSKENGVLLPSLVFVVEFALLRNNLAVKKFQRIRLFALGASVAVFLVYVSPITRSWFEVNEYRGFSPWERLQTEFYIIWKYIYFIFFPKVAYFGPFQDQNYILSDPVKIVASGLGLLIVGVGAFLFRKRAPWLLFAVLWFFVGHLLESTTVMLELYYEHRNYIPLVGVSMLFARLTVFLIKKLGGVVRVAVYGYIGVNAGILFLMTSLWGNPIEAAEFWVETNPGSIRAVVHQVNLSVATNQNEVAKNNEATLQVNKIVAAMQLLDRTLNWCRDCLNVRLQALTYSCIVEENDQTRRRLKEIEDFLLQGERRINDASIDGTAALSRLILEDKCKAIDYSDIDKILDQMLQQSGKNIYSKQLAKIHYQKATLGYAEHRYEDAERSISEADRLWPDAEPIIEYKIEYYIERGEPQKVVNYIEEKMQRHAKGEIHLSTSYLKNLELKLSEIRHGDQHSSSSKK